MKRTHGRTHFDDRAGAGAPGALRQERKWVRADLGARPRITAFGTVSGHKAWFSVLPAPALGGVLALLCTLGVSWAAAKSPPKARQEGAQAPHPDKVQAAQARAAERQAPARFDWSGRPQVQAAMDERADQKRDEAIVKLQRLLTSIEDGPQRAELLFRLSEMFWSKAKYKHLQAMQRWDRELEAWHAGGAQGPEPQLDVIPEYGESGAFKRSALKLYQEILEAYPGYPRKDEVLYNLGSALYEGGDEKEGVARYWQLLKEVPNSEFAADAWLQLGEHLFSHNRLGEAEEAYKKAAQTKKPRIYSFALYKLAWCDSNLENYTGALEKLREVVSYAQARAGDAEDFGANDRIQLLEEALTDMVRVYTHLEALDDAFAYYIDAVGRERAYRYLEKLAQRYHQVGKFALELKAYQLLNRDYPNHPHAPQNQTAIMRAYADLGKAAKVREEVRRLVDLYAPGGAWARQNADDPKVLERAFAVVEEKLAGLVTEQHRAAQETKLVETYTLARDIYREYLDKFPNAKNAYNFRFFYAEILFELKDFEMAAQQYDRVASREDGTFARPAAYASILSWEKVAAGETEPVGQRITEGRRGKDKGELKKIDHQRTRGGGEPPTLMSPAEQKLADACDRFLRIAPEDEQRVLVAFKGAQLYAQHHQFEEASRRFAHIIDTWPEDPLARGAAEAILYGFRVREDWSALHTWARRIRENPALTADKRFARQIDEHLQSAAFREIHHVFETREPPARVAERYAALANEFSEGEVAPVALYNAIINYDRANLLEKAINAAEALVARTKKSEARKGKRAGGSGDEEGGLPDAHTLRERAMFLLASFYGRIARFDAAAEMYEQYAREFSEAQGRGDALFNAGVYREGLGDYDAALQNFTAYMSATGDPKDASQMPWRIGLILERKGDTERVWEHYRALSEKSRRDPAKKLCADHKVALALADLSSDGLKREGKKGRSSSRNATKRERPDELYRGIVEAYGKLSPEGQQVDCARTAAAHAAFALVEPLFAAYTDIPLAGVKEKQMAKNLIRKLELINELQGRYTQVLAIGHGDYGIASLYRIGAVYEHLAKELYALPCPSNLNDDQCMIYQAELQQKAFPLEEKAIEAYGKAVAKGYELGLYNQWLTKARQALATYEPHRFVEVPELELIASEAAWERPQLLEIRP